MTINPDQLPDEAAITFDVVDLGTQRDKRKLVSSDGFNFTFKRQNKNSTMIIGKTTTRFTIEKPGVLLSLCRQTSELSMV
jgi:hypothetical protein